MAAVDAAKETAHIYVMARGISMHRLDSSSVKAAGYDRSRHTLRLSYVGGATYDYLDVPEDVFHELLDASSKGQFVNWNVKPHYDYQRVN
jgi:KTSC domain